MADTTLHIQETIDEQSILTIESICSQLDGIERALVDVREGKVKIKYNEEQISPEQIMVTIKQHGFHLLQ